MRAHSRPMMDNRKPFVTPNNGNSHVQKRRWEQTPSNTHTTKKARHDSDTFHKSYTASEDAVLPDPAPPLPPISREYETIVFTHPGSTVKGLSSHERVNYDRLEYLGDAYIEIIASRLIFDSYPDTNAGGMCRLRESVVKNETLSRYSAMYGFDKKLDIRGVPPDGRKGWTKIYGDVFEAYAAAVVLSDSEKGEDRLRAWLTQLWAPALSKVKSQLPKETMGAKEELRNKIVCPGVKLNYVDERKPIMHVGQGRETFFIGVYMDGWGWKNQHLGSGEGQNKTVAGQEAALNALKNRPLIDEIAAKKTEHLMQKEVEAQERESQAPTAQASS